MWERVSGGQLIEITKKKKKMRSPLKVRKHLTVAVLGKKG